MSVCRRTSERVRCMCEHGCICGCEVCERARRSRASVCMTVHMTLCILVGGACECITGACLGTCVVWRGKCECACRRSVLCCGGGMCVREVFLRVLYMGV